MQIQVYRSHVRTTCVFPISGHRLRLEMRVWAIVHICKTKSTGHTCGVFSSELRVCNEPGTRAEYLGIFPIPGHRLHLEVRVYVVPGLHAPVAVDADSTALGRDDALALVERGRGLRARGEGSLSSLVA